MKNFSIFFALPFLFLACQSAEDYFGGSSYKKSNGGCDYQFNFLVDKTLTYTNNCFPSTIITGTWSVTEAAMTITATGLGTENCTYDRNGALNCPSEGNFTRL